ncbi:MAG TPA: type I restriction endonuclease subunit R [Bacilli bacterium]|nr:type I restriction endonuclease subunit R [Bacilli bacterium]
MKNIFNEDNLIEKPAIKIFTESLGYQFVNAFKEKYGANFYLNVDAPCLGRENTSEVVLTHILRESLKNLNPGVKGEIIELAIEELTKDRSLMSLVSANKEIYNLIKNGINVSYLDEDGSNCDERIKVVDFNEVGNNDFLLVSQFWITGDMYKRRADLIGFINGLPLIFIEFKAVHKNLKDAFSNNLKDYKDSIPQLFWYNAFIILSNGIESKIGSITSEFEHFNEWKKINSEGERGIVSLDTIIKGICAKDKFIDLFENFILFDILAGKEVKIAAKNHQYLGVNNAITSLKQVKENKEERGRLGVFWHTQGSGKSYSMIFFSQKVLRKFQGNYTFLVVTDRQELDGQIYKNFANVGAVKEPEDSVHASSIVHLRELLSGDHRIVFTLIQKFQMREGEKQFPVLSDRSDIIVMTDEAHRSQYDLLALNMRNALPHANFIGFTGTPLIKGEEQETVETFGDYVSVYNFRQSVEDGATVPLYYENRIPSLQLKAEELELGVNNLLEEVELDEDQEKKLVREFEREYHLITREDRLNEIAKDCITHFNERGNDGKAMFVTIDRLTAVKMYNKLKAQPGCPDIAVVISSSQNEIDYFKKYGLDIVPHRQRMANEDLETKFKDPNDPLRIVIVCNMWLTGFDVQCLSTLYIDKPMKNHTLMQTIARANRVYIGKENGLIVDYIGVFRNLQKALAVYATGTDDVNNPIKPKEDLVQNLEFQIKLVNDFCNNLKIDLEKIKKSDELEKIQIIEEAVDIILTSEESQKKYLAMADQAVRFFGAILPDKSANRYFEQVKLFRVLANRIRVLTKKEVDIEAIADKIERILDQSIEADGYKIKDNSKITDLSKIDFEKLKNYFSNEKKHIATEKLKAEIENKLKDMIKLNSKRMDLADKFKKLIEEYNSGAKNIEEFFEELMKFAQGLNEEEKRSARENLSEEELAIFDLLYKNDLSEKEKNKIKKVAHEILEKLNKGNKLVLDWRKKQQARADVRVTIRDIVFTDLPESYSQNEKQACFDFVYQHVYDSYYGNGNDVYALAHIN